MLARVKQLTEAMTQTQMFSDIEEKTELARRQVADVFEALESVWHAHWFLRHCFATFADGIPRL